MILSFGMCGSCDVGAADRTDRADERPTVIGSGSGHPIVGTDSDGRQVSIPAIPERVVVLDSSVAEILVALGESSCIVGAHDLVPLPPALSNVARVGDSYQLNAEVITALDPDLVCTYFERAVAQLAPADLPVLYLEVPDRLVDIPDRFRLWGRIMGCGEKGESLAEEFERGLASIQRRVEERAEDRTVYHDAWINFWTCGSGTLASDVYEFLGLRNVFFDLKDYSQVSPEEIVLRSPDLIVSMGPEAADFLCRHPATQGLPAIQSERIFVMNGPFVGMPGPNLLRDLRQLEQWLDRRSAGAEVSRREKDSPR